MSDRSTRLPDGAQALTASGFNQYVGPLYALPDAGEDGVKRYGFVVEDRHMNAAGTVHGGMLMSLADTAMGHCAGHAAGARGGSTVSLNCDFVGPARKGELVEAHVRVTRSARTIVFASAELFADGRIVLVANGLWRVFTPR